MKICLNKNWLVRGEKLSWQKEMLPGVMNRKEGWYETDIPCDIHMPLIKNGVIKEPVEGENCFDCEWTEGKSWWFKKEFNLNGGLLEEDSLRLVFESIDSAADIFLNGYHISHHNSSFYPFACEVKKYLKQGKNILIVRVTSGQEYYSNMDLSELKNYTKVKPEQKRGERKRIFLRKPQYVFGWDWCPRIATCGIVKRVYLEYGSTARINSVFADTLYISDNISKISVEIETENIHPFETIEGTLKIQIFHEKTIAVQKEWNVLLKSGLNFSKEIMTINNPKLWWPNGMGEQNIYTVKVSCRCGDMAVSHQDIKFGVRTVELDTSKADDYGNNFSFKINSVRVFCKGANWIPADSIYARVTDEKYSILLNEAKEANFNMLRVWGGGIYEKDIFYNLCDELGIMVWQDFMFACSLYPDNLEWFRKEVQKEMDYQTKRLRNHCSLVLWCGGNENQEQFFRETEEFGKPPFFGGAACYNYIAPETIKNNCPSVPYWNSSPYGGDRLNNYEIGDCHYWEECMMHKDMEKRITPEEYDNVTSRFVSEYGHIGPCRKPSIIKYHAEHKLDRKGQIWQLHNNIFEKNTVDAMIKKHYRSIENLDIDSYLLYAGLCQGLMLGYSLESIRFNKKTWGSLFWMYNDCWGETGWSIIDYYLLRKISYYYVKRAFSPLKIIIREKNNVLRGLFVNDTKKEVNVTLEYGYTDFAGRKNNTGFRNITMKPFSRQIQIEFEKGKYDFKKGTFYINPVGDVEGLKPALFRAGVFKELDIPEAEPVVTDYQFKGGFTRIKIRTDAFAHAIHFKLPETVCLSDEYFDLLPGDEREILINKEIKQQDINVFFIKNTTKSNI